MSDYLPNGYRWAKRSEIKSHATAPIKGAVNIPVKVVSATNITKRLAVPK